MGTNTAKPKDVSLRRFACVMLCDDLFLTHILSNKHVIYILLPYYAVLLFRVPLLFPFHQQK